MNEAVMIDINSVVETWGDFVGALRGNVIQVIGNYSARNVPTEYDEQITKLQGEMLALIEENVQKVWLPRVLTSSIKKLQNRSKALIRRS